MEIRYPRYAALLTAGTVMVLCGCLSSSVRYTRDGNATLPRKKKHAVASGREYRAGSPATQQRLKSVAAKYIGIPYRYGGMSRNGVDCSGLVCLIYNEVSREKLPHSTKLLRRMGGKVGKRSAKCGDLVFFRRGFLGRVDHVGIYLEGNTFIHASTKRGVVYSNLDDDYYRKHFVEMRRIF